MLKNAVGVLFVVVAISSAPVAAQQSATFGWEDGTSTALGIYGGANLENSNEQANTGARSLKYWEDPIGGTPQAYIWWVTGLTDGDIIDAGMYFYDVTPSANPSGRIWAHYTDDPNDIESYAGSAGGNDTYPAGTGWEELSYSWTFDSASGTRDGIVIEARLYSGDLTTNTIYVDDASITVSSNSAVIYAADGSVVPVELQSFSIE